MKKPYKIVLLIVLCLLSIAGFGWNLLQSKPIEAEVVAYGDLQTEFTTSGMVLPRKSEVLNAASSGAVKEISCKAGDRVTKDTVLLRLGYENRTDLELQREQYRQQLTAARQTYDRLFGEAGTAQANLETARKDYELAEKNYQNGKVLAGDSISQMELSTLENQRDKAKQALALAEEEASESNQNYYQQLIDSCEAQLKAIETEVAPGEITMPYDGVVWEVYPETGGYVTANQPVLKVYQPGDMKIEISLLTEDAVWLKQGEMVSCEYADGTQSEAEIRFISTIAGQKVSTIGMEENRCQVELEPKQLPDHAGAGYQVDVTYSLTMAEHVLFVSSSALVPIQQGTGVYVITGGKAVLREVKTGKKAGGKVEVMEGLEEGDLVVTDPYEDDIREGSRVKAAT